MGRVGNTGTQRNVQSQLDKNAVVSCELCCATSSTGHIDQQLALASRPSSFGAPLKDVHIVAYVAYVARVGADRCLHKPFALRLKTRLRCYPIVPIPT